VWEGEGRELGAEDKAAAEAAAAGGERRRLRVFWLLCVRVSGVGLLGGGVVGLQRAKKKIRKRFGEKEAM
jgi:hypothetical protein